MRKLSILILLLVGMLLSILPAYAQVDETLKLRVAHWSPDAPPVDIYANGELVIENLEYPTVTVWMDIDEGVYDIAIAPAGTSIDEAVIGPLTFNLVEDTWITVAAVGSVEAGTLATNVLIEDYSPLRDADFARISITHAIDGAPPITVMVNELPAASSLAYPGTKGNNDGFFTREVPAELSDIRVFVTNEPTVEIANETGIALEAGLNYLMAVIGTPDAPELLIVATSLEGDVVVSNMDAMAAQPLTDETSTAEEASSEETSAEEDTTAEESTTDETMSDEEMTAEEASSEDTSADEAMPEVEATEEPMSDEDMSDDEAMPEVETTEEPMSDEDMSELSNTIADIVVATEAEDAEFSVLLAALMVADPSIAATLGDPDAEITVFAPTDEAFLALLDTLEIDIDTLLSDTDLLNAVLPYHVVEGAVMADAVMTMDGEAVPTLLGDANTISITVTEEGVVLNDTINVIETDIIADNGVIHIIDGVLVPTLETG